jgi:ribosomal protein S6
MKQSRRDSVAKIRKVSMNRSYELIVVFDPTLTESVVKDEVKKWRDFIAERDGTDISIEEWGKKELSFSLKKHKAGAFVVIRYSTVRHSLVNDLAAVLRISEPVIKFQSHRINLPLRKFQGNPKRDGIKQDSSEFDSLLDSM